MEVPQNWINIALYDYPIIRVALWRAWLHYNFLTPNAIVEGDTPLYIRVVLHTIHWCVDGKKLLTSVAKTNEL